MMDGTAGDRPQVKRLLRGARGIMGLYAKYILPRMIDIAMRNKDTARLRAEWIPKARGTVLEIGIGSGLNLSFYSPEVLQVYGVDPSRELQRMARNRAVKTSRNITFLTQSAEEPIPLDANSVDTVVMTWTLCSIPDPSRALEEAKRVLRPRGVLIFLEHGLSKDSKVAAWQNRLTPMWKHIGGGCHLNRRVDSLILNAGFRIGELRTGYLPGPRPMTFNYQGLAHLAQGAA
jgi:SAM-dependent methyltransferase